MTSTMQSLTEARTQIRRLIEEQAVLRGEVGTAQQAEDRASAPARQSPGREPAQAASATGRADKDLQAAHR